MDDTMLNHALAVQRAQQERMGVIQRDLLRYKHKLTELQDRINALETLTVQRVIGAQPEGEER